MKTTPGTSARVGDADIYARIDEAVTDAAADLVRWRRHLHQHPELSNREVQTAAYLIDQLRETGVDDIRSELAGHGIVAIIRGRAIPRVDCRIALRADMDALPVRESTGLPYASRVEARSEAGQRVPVSHACGHDCHLAVALAAARVLVRSGTRSPATSSSCSNQPKKAHHSMRWVALRPCSMLAHFRGSGRRWCSACTSPRSRGEWSAIGPGSSLRPRRGW